jgi:hypothetical protein
MKQDPRKCEKMRSKIRESDTNLGYVDSQNSGICNFPRADFGTGSGEDTGTYELGVIRLKWVLVVLI